MKFAPLASICSTRAARCCAKTSSTRCSLRFGGDLILELGDRPTRPRELGLEGAGPSGLLRISSDLGSNLLRGRLEPELGRLLADDRVEDQAAQDRGTQLRDRRASRAASTTLLDARARALIPDVELREGDRIRADTRDHRRRVRTARARLELHAARTTAHTADTATPPASMQHPQASVSGAAAGPARPDGEPADPGPERRRRHHDHGGRADQQRADADALNSPTERGISPYATVPNRLQAGEDRRVDAEQPAPQRRIGVRLQQRGHRGAHRDEREADADQCRQGDPEHERRGRPGTGSRRTRPRRPASAADAPHPRPIEAIASPPTRPPTPPTLYMMPSACGSDMQLCFGQDRQKGHVRHAAEREHRGDDHHAADEWIATRRRAGRRSARPTRLRLPASAAAPRRG